MAEDPLAAVNLFVVQIRTVLAAILGIRMCPNCPQCMCCQDALGSVAELMGGIAGRADAMFGAVECQKTTGSLHYHLFLFIQRLHQFCTLKEIAELLVAKLVEAQELKDFLSNICCETYTDVEQHRSNVPDLEAKFPAYSENSECWGDFELGRIPQFLYVDAERLQKEESHNVPMPKGNNASPVQFKAMFKAAFQYFQERCQHHLHKLVDGKRVVPKACRSKTKPKECKHEAPWTNRVSPAWMTQPLVVCKGIAEKSKLRCSGARNWLGQILGLRNDEWVNGTMPGLCVAFAGSNSDVKPNDRLPILPETHESCCKRKRCLVKKHTLKRTTRITQRAQSVCNGYFGGYIGKRQPGGSLETKKCVDKLLTLRAKMRGQGKASQARAASGRQITDLEMNSTYRGAVEVFNLCRNLHPHDVLFAECIRTFNAASLDGRSWMFRLEATQLTQRFRDECLQTYVPPTKRQNVRTDRARANEFEAYGYRPLRHPWKLLSPYEFLREWTSEALLIP